MSLASPERLTLAPEELFLITYDRNGLMQRDSWFEQGDEAQRHLAYLQGLFPNSGVQLHVIPYEVPHQPEAKGNAWRFLEF